MNKKQHLRLLSTLLSSLLLVSCAMTPSLPPQTLKPSVKKQKPIDVYKTISIQKSLIASPQFKVIDDFSSGEYKNNLGGSWHLDNTKGKKAKVRIIQEDARHFHHGSSLRITFDLDARNQFSLQSSLEKLDMSQAQYFVMQCKSESPNTNVFNGRARVGLTDWRGKTVIRDITEACRENKGWNEVLLPITLFKGLDFDQLSALRFTILSRNQATQGEFWVDEIAFFGPNEVAFESHRDNLVGFPRTVVAFKQAEKLRMTRNDKTFLKEIARDTWRYFENAADKNTHLVVDHIRTGDAPLAANYTSPTNIAMDLMATVAAVELKFINRQEAVSRIAAVFSTMRKMKRWKGFFYNFYDTNKLSITREFVSSVDSGWLAISLVVVRQAFQQEFFSEATKFLDEFDFGEFLDPQNNHLAVGIDTTKNEMTPFHYGLLVSEARATSFYGIGKGDLPRDHWWFIYRTAPESWRWQTQTPKGRWVEREGIEYFQGYYEFRGEKFVPSWGGSLFEFLMPTLVLDEKRLAPFSLGPNNQIATELQRDYALVEKEYPVWGISPAAVTNGRRWQYGEFGVRAIGAKGYPDRGVITPHVSFLALQTLPQDAIQNIRRFLEFDIYGEYGFYDSVNMTTRKVNHQYLALDQGMILVALANYLKRGVIQKLFYRDPISQRAKDLLAKERFFIE